ncbi:MAG: PQQ-dependent sugar dehydrogenase [Flavobacteriaceae bacterium]
MLSLKSRLWIIVVFSLLLLAAVPIARGPGLTNIAPVEKYLNGTFPSRSPSPLPYQPVFPNLSFDSPLAFAMHPYQNKIIVGQRDGKIYWFNKQDQVSTKSLIIDLSNEVGVVWDGGFLGFALHPEFGLGSKNYFYTYYTTKDQNGNDFPNTYTTQNCDNEEYWGNHLMLVRFEADPDTMEVIPDSQTTLIKIRMYGTSHRGGGMLFGKDGFLYLTTGDQTAFRKSQDIINNLDGGVLRIDVDKDPAKSHPPVKNMPDDHGFEDELTGNEYWIPNDNPFLSPSGENFEEYYTMGHRNPHRMTMDMNTGLMYIGEVGGVKHEEVNVVQKGRNYGWPVYEGLSKDNACGDDQLFNNMDHEEPLVAFPRRDANSLTGGYVYQGTEIPELIGKYICADYGNGAEIWAVDTETGLYELLGNFEPSNIISFGQDDEGEVYILKQGVSTLYKLSQRSGEVGEIPQFLSQTGAFESLDDLSPSAGLVAYDLIQPFWSDGAIKKRWMVIPNDGTHDQDSEQIDFSENDPWQFPEGAVLVKHFELPVDDVDPGKTKRLETRFSIKGEDGNFYFVTYKWNETQTDAELLENAMDEEISIQNGAGGTRMQTWHYPSRTECFSCHNTSSGGTLGARTRNLNKQYTYEETGVTSNQLLTLSSLGILNSEIEEADIPNFISAKSLTDTDASLDEKARSYLDVNCAYCHRPGTGNRAEFDLRLKNTLEETHLLTAGYLTSLGIDGEGLLVPGDAAKSILYQRLLSLDENIMMPPLAKKAIDIEGAALIEAWINNMEAIQQPEPEPEPEPESEPEIPTKPIAELIVAPNPIKSGQELEATFKTAEAGEVSVRIINLNGQVVSEFSALSEVGENRLSLPTTYLSSGIYLMGIWVGKDHELQKMLVY